MAKISITKTVGTTAVSFSRTDITEPQDSYVAVAADLNTADVWVNLDPLGTTTAVEGDNHVPVRPGEAVPFLVLPLSMIAATAGNKITVGPR